ncbi:MAG: ATP-binding protein [Planctomycetota bacterium]
MVFGSANPLASWDWFSNFGSYRSHIDNLRNADGGSDWVWLFATMALQFVIIAAYVRVFIVWRKAYLSEAPEDRNRRLMQLGWMFLMCGTAGYALSLLMFVWPAYRLTAIVLLAVAVVIWVFAWRLDTAMLTLTAGRLKRELGEEYQKRAEQAEAANKAKSDFLANMSHEIRTPMTAVVGYAELLRDNETDAELQDEYSERIQRNAKHLLTLVNDVLDLSKIEADQLMLTPESACVETIIVETVEMLQHRAKNKGIELMTRFESSTFGEMPGVVIDVTRVRQILVNLIGNAIKFTSEGSVLVWADVTERDGDAVLEIVVRDTGIGISPEVQDRLFQPFCQGDETVTRRYGGTGLGLVICRRLAQAMGGDVTLSSEPQRGSTFVVSFPVEVTARPIAEDAAKPASDAVAEIAADEAEVSPSTMSVAPATQATAETVAADTKRVLLVEDGEDNQRLISFHVQRAGHTVVVAENGQVGLSLFKKEGPFDLVLMDMQMPILDGYATAQELREQGSTVPIVALTAHAMAGDRERCINAGCDDYLSKPIDRDRLLETIDMWTQPREVERRAA